MKRLETFDINGLKPALRHCNSGAKNDVLNTNGCCYYQWTACLIDMMKPKQVVELGGAMGVWALCALHYLPEDSILHSITLEEFGIEFSFIKDKYPNLNMITGDDLDMKHWEGIDLTKTDLWFFDSLHTEEQLRKEMELYGEHIKKGALVLFDDIRMPELWPVWQDIMDGKYGGYDTHEGTDPLHYSGYGLAVKT